MVHSTFIQGHVMDGRDTSPLGIPKSPSFHSGLDLVASASVGSFVDLEIPVVASSGEKSPFAVVEGANTTYLHNFTLTLRKDKSPNGVGDGTGKTDGFYYDSGWLRKNNDIERAMQIQGHLPRLAGISNILLTYFLIGMLNIK